MTANTAFQADEVSIQRLLDTACSPDPVQIREILQHAGELHGLAPLEVVRLMHVTDPALLDELHHTARRVKEEIYGNRIVLFAPLYVSNLCSNDCLYCAFRSSNKGLVRRALSQEEIAAETRALLRTGQKRVLLVAGEAYPREGLGYILRAIRTIYDTHEGPGTIRRINVNIAPLSVDDFRRLHAAAIGTYQLFQETYHKPTYESMHVSGKKRDFRYRLESMDRAMTAGIDDVGIGVLFGLADWRYEVLALMQHAAHLEQRFGCGPHTISLPRLEPAAGSPVSVHPPCAVSDVDFMKLVAILRLAVPYTGMILSTRERPEIRRACLQLGISQLSAGSRTNPGGYEQEDAHAMQFSLGDHRSLDEVVRDLCDLGFIPSFCTACYRLGRVGADFMDLAKPGDIKLHCQPNAVSTFLEYLQDYATPETVAAGRRAVATTLAGMAEPVHGTTRQMVRRVEAGERDVYC